MPDGIGRKGCALSKCVHCSRLVIPLNSLYFWFLGTASRVIYFNYNGSKLCPESYLGTFLKQYKKGISLIEMRATSSKQQYSCVQQVILFQLQIHRKSGFTFVSSINPANKIKSYFSVLY